MCSILYNSKFHFYFTCAYGLVYIFQFHSYFEVSLFGLQLHFEALHDEIWCDIQSYNINLGYYLFWLLALLCELILFYISGCCNQTFSGSHNCSGVCLVLSADYYEWIETKPQTLAGVSRQFLSRTLFYIAILLWKLIIHNSHPQYKPTPSDYWHLRRLCLLPNWC